MNFFEELKRSGKCNEKAFDVTKIDTLSMQVSSNITGNSWTMKYDTNKDLEEEFKRLSNITYKEAFEGFYRDVIGGSKLKGVG